jgi:hypothetical protein
MDRVKWYYRLRNGYDIARGAQILREEGFRAHQEYSRRYFSVRDVRAFLTDFTGGVIDFGGSHSYYPDPGTMHEACRMFAPFRNVTLLVPSPDIDECVSILRERLWRRYAPIERDCKTVASCVDMNYEFIVHESNRLPAKHVVYTNGMTVADVGEQIIHLAGKSAGLDAPPEGDIQLGNEVNWRIFPGFA